MLPLALVMLGLGTFSLSDKVALGSHVYQLPDIWSPLAHHLHIEVSGFWGDWESSSDHRAECAGRPTMAAGLQ